MSSAVGFDSGPFVDFSFKDSIDFERVPIRYFKSLSYLIADAAFKVWWHLLNMYMVFKIKKVILEAWQ